MLKRNGLGLVAALGLAQILCGQGTVAAGSAGRALLQDELSARTPSNWMVHVSDRGDMLLAFITPPYQEAFDLWYDPMRLRDKMLGLCPGSKDRIWSQLSPRQSIDIQPTVGGKSTDAMRLSCPRGAPPA